VDEWRIPECHVLRPAHAAGELAFDRDRVIQVVRQPAAGGVHVEVHFPIVIAADEEGATARKPTNLNLSSADRCILRRRSRASA
jgi:hypothetical protein